MSQLSELDLNRQLYKTQPQTLETQGASDIAAIQSAPPSTAVSSGNTVTDVNTNSEQLNGSVIAPGTIPAGTLNIANFGWTQTCVFSVVDSDTVAWTGGTFTSANGVSVYSIGPGSTGNMTVKTYVYLDINVSKTAYQVSTVQTDAVGLGKVFIALCQNGTTAATYNLVQTSQIISDNILANSIDANKLNVAVLSAISADLGTITAGTITVTSGGDTVAITPAATNAIISGPTGSPTFTLTKAGDVTTKSIQILNQYTAGENVTAGKLLCFKNTFAAWGDYSGASRNTTAVCDRMTYVFSAAGSANTNFGSASLCLQGGNSGGGGVYTTYFKLDLSSSPPGLPAWNEIDTINLRLYIVFASNDGSTATRTLSMVTSSWSEGTVTYNTRPTDDGIVWSTGQVVTQSFGSETNASTANGTVTGYIDFDITEIYRLISQGTYTNNGFRINDNSTNNGYIQLGGRTRSGGGDFNQAPFVVSYITKDNPGSGNTIVANDGKVYTASNANYQRIKQIAGVCGSTVSVGATTDVYSLADGLVIPSSVISVDNNQDYFLIDSSGTIGKLTNNILESSKWDFRIGTGSPRGLIVNTDKRPIFIRSNSLATQLPPPNCTQVYMNLSVTDVNGVVSRGQLFNSKGFLTSALFGSGYAPGSTSIGGSLSWSSGTSGTISASLSLGGGSGSFTLYFYK